MSMINEERGKSMYLLINSLIRGGIPFIIMTAISIALKFQGKLADAKSTFIVACILLFVGAATNVYQLDTLSLLQKTFLHFLIMLVTIFPLLLVSGWFPLNSFLDGVKVLLYFCLTGIVLWSVIMLIRKLFGLDS